MFASTLKLCKRFNFRKSSCHFRQSNGIFFYLLISFLWLLFVIFRDLSALGGLLTHTHFYCLQIPATLLGLTFFNKKNVSSIQNLCVVKTVKRTQEDS